MAVLNRSIVKPQQPAATATAPAFVKPATTPASPAAPASTTPSVASTSSGMQAPVSSRGTTTSSTPAFQRPPALQGQAQQATSSPAASAWANLMASGSTQSGASTGGGANATGLTITGGGGHGADPNSSETGQDRTLTDAQRNAYAADNGAGTGEISYSSPNLPGERVALDPGQGVQTYGADGNPSESNYDMQADRMWQSAQKDYESSLDGQMSQSYADEARAGRAADVQSAMLGQGVSGGGYQAGQAQVALGGMQQRQDTLSKHYQQGQQMKLAYLETLIKRAEASKDRALQEKLQAEADKTLLALQGAGIDTTDTAGTGTSQEPTGTPRDSMTPEQQTTYDEMMRNNRVGLGSGRGGGI